MTDAAIEALDVVVKYRPYVDVRGPSGPAAFFRRRRITEEVTALSGVSFAVQRGEAFGVIGGNGAGKSTLLRVLAGTLLPDSGSVRYGEAVEPALLQLGAGFNAHLSGRENVYLGGLAAGLSRAEIRSGFDRIVEFADLGQSIDRPLNTYSSGMRARLGFAVAIERQPGAMLVDEVLSVGDTAFKAKSTEAMRKLVEDAKTVVFVSHALGSVRRFCDRVLWLESGRVRLIGPAADVVDAYREAVDPQPAPEPVAEMPGWTTNDKTAAVRRLLLGEAIVDVSEDTGASVKQLRRWRTQYLAAGRHAMQPEAYAPWQAAKLGAAEDDED